MEDTQIYFVDVLLPLHIPDCYTYRVPQEYNGMLQPGQRVVVQFGHQRIYSALVRRVHQTAPPWKSKYILAILDTAPIVTERQMEFWEWLARYYMCYPGDVMAMALPAGMKLASESTVAIHPDFDGDLSALSKHEQQVVQLLGSHPVMRVADIGNALGLQKVMPLIRTMIERSIIVMDEELRQRFTPKTSTYLQLAEGYRSEEAQRCLLDELERKKRTKQVKLLMQLLQMSHFGEEPVAKRLLPQGSALQTLLKNGVLVSEERLESRIEHYDEGELLDPADIQLNEEQQRAFQQLSTFNFQLSTYLLLGVTSSGKTEVYIKLIDEVVRQGRQALLLLPEIALTTQVINRLKRYFGDKVGVYHSRFSSSQRVEVWQRTLATGQGRYQVLLGARSALMLPFTDLALIIVDEEHDPSYKQQEPTPRYHARDAALYLASRWGARVVLGSATPSIESFWGAQSGRYGLATITQRYGGYSLPEVKVVDMREAHKNHEVKGHFSTTLLKAIDDLELKPVEEPFRFDDVKDSGKFYFAPVYWAYEHEPQITKGTSEKLFSPDAGCTRGQVVTFLWRAMNEPEPTSTKNPFEDVKEGAYYYKAVLWAVEKGITKGTSDTTFRPDQTCTRGQIVTFLYRAQDPKPELKDKNNPFKDVAESAYYYDAVLWAVENDITKGKAEGFFRPELTCTRGEIVTFLYRAMAEEEAE